MPRRTWSLSLAAFLAFTLAWAGHAAAQTELDRVVTRVSGRAITRSDIRLARALRLVDDHSSDEACQRALENRLLALAEVGRLMATVSVADEAVSTRRTEWERGVGGAAPAQKLLGQYEMSDADLSGWFRDDLRISAYLDRQFGSLDGDARAKATADWFGRLRQRADLR